jgi:hypothetical protein
MQQEICTAMDEDKLRAVTGGTSDRATATTAVGAGAGGAIGGATIGAAVTRHKMQGPLQKVKTTLKAENKIFKNAIVENGTLIRQTVRTISRAR